MAAFSTLPTVTARLSLVLSASVSASSLSSSGTRWSWLSCATKAIDQQFLFGHSSLARARRSRSNCSTSASSASEPRYASDRLLVKFKSNAGEAAIAHALQAAKVTNKSTIRDLGVHVVGVSPHRLDTALATLRRSPRVLYAEHDGFVTPQEVLPNDPYFFWTDGRGTGIYPFEFLLDCVARAEAGR